jgi:hypothetical protein
VVAILRLEVLLVGLAALAAAALAGRGEAEAAAVRRDLQIPAVVVVVNRQAALVTPVNGAEQASS